jgi:hypothetical protein
MKKILLLLLITVSLNALGQNAFKGSATTYNHKIDYETNMGSDFGSRSLVDKHYIDSARNKARDSLVTVLNAKAYTKAVTIESPTTSENIGLFYTDVAITITKLADVLRGTSPSVTYQINHATDRSSGSPNTLFSSSRVSTSTTGATTTSFNDATIPAGSWVWLTTSANSGTVAEINITLTYTID